MKIVLRHRVTGRYYHSPGKWVRRADNALSFEDMSSARAFTRNHHLHSVQAVPRLAPYLMPLLQRPRRIMLDAWAHRNMPVSSLDPIGKFFRN